MVKPPVRTKSIGTKVSDEEYAQLEKLAQAHGQTLGEWWAGGPGFAFELRVPCSSGFWKGGAFDVGRVARPIASLNVISASHSNTTPVRPLRVKILNLGCPVLEAFQGRGFWFDLPCLKDCVAATDCTTCTSLPAVAIGDCPCLPPRARRICS